MALLTSHYLSDGDTIAPGTSIALNDGAHYALISGTLEMSQPGTVSFSLHIWAATAREATEYAAAVQQMLALAEKRSADYHATAWVTYILQRGTDAPAYLDIKRGTMVLEGLYVDGTAARWKVTLETLDAFRWDKVELDVTSELVNGDAMLEVLNVPGDIDALVRLEIQDTSDDMSGTNAINRIRGARNSGDGALAANWQPFINFDDVVDSGFGAWAYSRVTSGDAADAIDGDFIRMANTNSGGFSGFGSTAGKVTTPAGELNQGERDIWLRARATSTAIDLTGSVTATKTEPTIVSEAQTQYATPAARFLTSWRSAGANNPSITMPSWTGHTTAGSTLVTILSGYGGTGGTTRDLTPVASTTLGSTGWQEFVRENTPAASVNTSWVMIYPNAPQIFQSGGGTRTWSWGAGATGSTAYLEAAMFEVANVGPSALELFVDAYDEAINRQHELAGVASTVPEVALIAARVQHANTTHIPAVAWFNGLEPVLDNHGFNAAIGMQGSGETVGLGVRSATEIDGVDLFLLGFRGTATPGTVETSRTNAGNLAAGSRTFTVYGVDVSGSVGDSIVSSATTLTNDGGKIVLSWTAAPADYYVAQWTFGGNTYRVLTNTNSVTITDEADAVFANDMPAITAGQSSGGVIYWAYGAGTDPYPAVSVGFNRMIPEGAAFKWHQLGTANLPPTGAALNGEWPQTTIYLSSAGMGSKDPVIDVDALWLVPHGEPQFIAEYAGLALPSYWETETERYWILESTRRGNAMVGWVQNQDDVIRGSVLVTGRMLLAPGDNLISILCDGQSGSAVIDDLTFTAKLTYWPRSHWQNWSTAP